MCLQPDAHWSINPHGTAHPESTVHSSGRLFLIVAHIHTYTHLVCRNIATVCQRTFFLFYLISGDKFHHHVSKALLPLNVVV